MVIRSVNVIGRARELVVYTAAYLARVLVKSERRFFYHHRPYFILRMTVFFPATDFYSGWYTVVQ